MVDDHKSADVVDQLGDRSQVGERAQRSRSRRHRNQTGRLTDQALPLPGWQITGFDVDLGPLHLGAETVCCAQPGRDVRLVVEPGHDHLVAQAGSGGRCVG
jgi:hypothetical protein